MVSSAKSSRTATLEAVLDNADKCIWQKMQNSKHPVVSLLEEDTYCNSVTDVAIVLADVK